MEDDGETVEALTELVETKVVGEGRTEVEAVARVEETRTVLAE